MVKEGTTAGAATMAVFITGGHGHIGSWAAYFLAKEGEPIIWYDTNPMVPDHLDEVARNINFIKGDVLDFPRLTAVFKKHKGDIGGIIHTVGVMGELGFEPKYSVAEGKKKYADWMQKVMKQGDY